MTLQDAGGKLDVLINNAGVLEEWKSINDSDPAEWWGSFEINVRCGSWSRLTIEGFAAGAECCGDSLRSSLHCQS